MNADKLPINNIVNSGLTNSKNNFMLNNTNSIGNINQFNNITQNPNLGINLNFEELHVWVLS